MTYGSATEGGRGAGAFIIQPDSSPLDVASNRAIPAVPRMPTVATGVTRPFLALTMAGRALGRRNVHLRVE